MLLAGNDCSHIWGHSHWMVAPELSEVLPGFSDILLLEQLSGCILWSGLNSTYADRITCFNCQLCRACVYSNAQSLH